MKKTYCLSVLLSGVLFFFGIHLYAHSEPGSGRGLNPPQTCLFPVGGGAISDDVLEAFLAYSPVKNPQLLIIPQAAREGREAASAERYVKRFAGMGVTNIQILDLSDPQRALNLIRESDVIWIPGGQQVRLRKALESVKLGLPEAIREQYVSGAAIVGGTSAGAAIMSDVMIASAKVDEETGLRHPVISYGLKLWPEMIIDQHFTERGRIDRLSLAMEQYPNHYGIGLDEGTGVFYTNQEKFTVIGAGTVTLMRPVTNGNVDVKHETIILESGDTFEFSTPESKTADRRSADTKRADLERLMLELGVPGAQIVHQKNGQSQVYHLGVKKYGSSEKVDENTIFQAASMSKVVAAYAFLRLYDRGVFDLDEPLMNYLVYPRLEKDPHAREITARMVLDHTTGLPNWATGEPLRTAFRPGTAFRYSGEGFLYLQRVIEHLTGKPLQQILEEEVFTPFGMEKSSFVYNDRIESDYAYGHHGPDGLQPTERRIFKNANAAYSMLTTASDYTIFVQEALLNGKGLKPATLRAFFTPSSSAQAADKSGEAYNHLSYGLGVLLQDNEVGRAVIHTGSNRGRYLCVFIGYPDTKESLVIMTNGSNGLEFRKEAAALLLDPQTLWAFER